MDAVIGLYCVSPGWQVESVHARIGRMQNGFRPVIILVIHEGDSRVYRRVGCEEAKRRCNTEVSYDGAIHGVHID